MCPIKSMILRIEKQITRSSLETWHCGPGGDGSAAFPYLLKGLTEVVRPFRSVFDHERTVSSIITQLTKSATRLPRQSKVKLHI